MPNFRAIKISIQKALNDTTRKIETLVSILKKNPHLKKTSQKILGKKSRQRKFEKGLYASVQGECTRCTPSSAYIYFSVSFVIALTICTDSRGSAAERLDN